MEFGLNVKSNGVFSFTEGAYSKRGDTMGYRITYGQDVIKSKLPPDRKKLVFRRIILAALACVAVALALSSATIRHYLLPGDPVVTERALQELVSDLRSGEKVSDAVTAFCQEILDNA